jgi:micrococcal nuclease
LFLKTILLFTLFFKPIIPTEIRQLEITGKVIKIVDGDTFDILTKSNITLRIRMNGIDAPERGQEYYKICKQGLASLIFKKNVTITTFGWDKYKRTIANIYLDKKLINLTMVEKGWAWHFVKYSASDALAKAQSNAKLKKLGLWQMQNAVAPWEFRKKIKTI